MRFVAFYWTYRDQGIRPEGLRNTPVQVRRRNRIKAFGKEGVDRAAELSLTISYMRAKARQMAEDQGGIIVDEVAYEEPGERPTEGAVRFLEKALRLCKREDAPLLMPDPQGGKRWRTHRLMKDDLVRRTNLGTEVEYFDHADVLIRHFRWHRAEEKKRLKNKRISRAVKKAIRHGAAISLGESARCARKEQQRVRTEEYYRRIARRVAGIRRELQRQGRKPTDAEMVDMLNYAEIPPPITAQTSKPALPKDTRPQWTVGAYRKARRRHGL